MLIDSIKLFFNAIGNWIPLVSISWIATETARESSSLLFEERFGFLSKVESKF